MLRSLLALLAAALAVLAVPVQAQSFGILYLPSPPVHGWPPATVPAKPARVGPVAYLAPEPVLAIAAKSERFARAAARPENRYSAQTKTLPEWQAPQPASFVRPAFRQTQPGRLEYGPFRIRDDRTLALVGPTDAASPEWFARALRDNPGLARLSMEECPGTHDDRANLKLGRMIRAAGLATHVPANGSVRSGAVELFLAGTSRSIADGAEFAVHSWRDERGREARDFTVDAPQNRTYLDYYREMGMTTAQARAFYDFTNSVPHHRALWLEAGEMRRWLR